MFFKYNGPGATECLVNAVQWNPSIKDTIGTGKSVLIREVSSFQGLICIETALWATSWHP